MERERQKWWREDVVMIMRGVVEWVMAVEDRRGRRWVTSAWWPMWLVERMGSRFWGVGWKVGVVGIAGRHWGQFNGLKYGGRLADQHCRRLRRVVMSA